MPGARMRTSASSWQIWWPLLLLALTFAILPATAAAYIYYPNGSHIGRALNNGSGLEPNFISSKTFNCGIAVDGGHIYWGAVGVGISRANLDGTGVEEEFIPLSPTAKPCGIAVDSAHVYWTDLSGAVGIADIDGGSPNPALISIEEPCGIASDGGHVYFAWKSGGEFGLSRFSLPYGGPEPPLTATAGNCGVAVDSQNVYWTNGGYASAGQNVQFANRDPFGPPQTLVTTESGANNPWSVAVHGGYVYYSPHGGPIGRARADGSVAPEPNFIPLGGFVETIGIAVDDLPAPVPPPTPPSPGPGGSPIPAPVKLKLTVGKVKTNVRNGTATVKVKVSAPGVVKLAGKKVKPVKATAKRAGKLSLKISAKKAAAAALRKAGKLRVSFTVTFSAPGADSVSAKKSVKLVR